MKRKIMVCTLICALFTSTVGVYGAEKKVSNDSGIVLKGHEKYNYAVSVLEKYYNEDGSVNKKYEGEAKQIEKSEKEIFEDYKGAAEERKKKDSLNYDPNTILVDFDKDMSNDEIKEIVEGISDSAYIFDEEITIDENLSAERIEAIKKADEMRQYKSVIVKLGKDQSTAKALEEYSKIDGVKSVDRDDYLKGVCSSGISTNDTYASELWYLDRINAETAWDTIKNANSCEMVKVAVIDTGIDLSHSDMSGRLDIPNCVDVTGDSIVRLDQMASPFTKAHGTNVAGVVNARANNNIGVAGVAGISDQSNGYGCRVMAIQVAEFYPGQNPNQDSPHFCTSTVKKAIEYAVRKGANSINFSIGFTNPGNSEIAELQEGVDYARNAGVTVVAAAGNDGCNDNEISIYPADCNHVINTIALNKNNQKCSFSNYGASKDISAPGIHMTVCNVNNGYSSEKYGTSLASPMVAAAAAMISSVNKDLTPAEIETIIKSTATDVDQPGKDDNTSYGLLNVGLAVQRAIYRTYYNVKPVITSISSPASGKAKIAWTRVGNEEDMLIYRSTSFDGTYERVGKVEANTSQYYTYVDSGLESGKVYYYKIRCRSAYGTTYQYGDYSNKVSFRAS